MTNTALPKPRRPDRWINLALASLCVAVVGLGWAAFGGRGDHAAPSQGGWSGAAALSVDAPGVPPSGLHTVLDNDALPDLPIGIRNSRPLVMPAPGAP